MDLSVARMCRVWVMAVERVIKHDWVTEEKLFEETRDLWTAMMMRDKSNPVTFDFFQVLVEAMIHDKVLAQPAWRVVTPGPNAQPFIDMVKTTCDAGGAAIAKDRISG